MKPSTVDPPEAPVPHATQVLPAEISVAETVGRLMHFWGFKRPMGRIWTILYLSPEPVSAAQLGSTLKMSAGAVSMALAELEKWGAITRTWIPGARRDYFVAEDDIWKLVRRVVRERELALVRDFGANLEQATRELSEVQPKGPSDREGGLRYKRDRLERLNRLRRAGETILSSLVAGDAVDPTELIVAPGAAPSREES